MSSSGTRAWRASSGRGAGDSHGKLKGLEEGVECEGHFGAKCVDGLVCGPDDTCIEPQADGAVCTDDDHCDSGECSSFGIEGECMPKDSDACGDW